MNNLPTILITGSNGQLGRELRDLASAHPGYRFVFKNREEMPIDDKEICRKIIDETSPAFIINCAAYTAVDRAETERDAAFSINGEAPGMLASLAVRNNSRFIHISSDYVFNGAASRPVKETDPVEPVNVYGESKLLGEKLVYDHDPGAIIIRTSWVYSAYGKNFVRTMISLMKEKTELRVVNDQYGCPTYAADLAAAILHIISSGQWHPGIYHYCNRGAITWFDFAAAIREIIQSGCTVIPVPTTAYPTPARRPRYSVLDTTRIRQIYFPEIPEWKDSLRKCIGRLLSNTGDAARH